MVISRNVSGERFRVRIQGWANSRAGYFAHKSLLEIIHGSHCRRCTPMLMRCRPICAYNVHACEIYAYWIHIYKMHAHKIHTPSTPIRYMPVRSTPMRCMPYYEHWRTQGCLLYLVITLMRCVPMRSTPMRYTPTRCTPTRCMLMRCTSMRCMPTRCTPMRCHRITICVRNTPHANSPSPEFALEIAPPIHSVHFSFWR